MEVLLLCDIPGVGKKNDILVVGDGFALNHLLPSRRALVATPTVRKRYAEQIKRRAEEKSAEESLRRSATDTLTGKTLTFARKSTKTGKLYAAVTEKNIAEVLAEQFTLTIAEENIEVSAPIKAIGTFTVHVVLGTTTLPLTVVVKEEEEAKKK